MACRGAVPIRVAAVGVRKNPVQPVTAELGRLHVICRQTVARIFG
jgi:hypothetical protein